MNNLERKLQGMKDEFKRAIPTSFTEADKQRVYEKLYEQRTISKNYWLSKALTFFAFIGAALFIIFIFAQDDFELFPSNETTNGDAFTNMANREESAPEGNLTEKSGVNYDFGDHSTFPFYAPFNHEQIKIGDVVGNFTITDIVEAEVDGKEEKRIVFESDEIIHMFGDIHKEEKYLFQFDDQDMLRWYEQRKFPFNQNPESLPITPIEIKDQSSSVQYVLESEVIVQGFFDRFSDDEIFPDVAITTKRLDYILGEGQSTIIINIHSPFYNVEMYTNTIEVDDYLIEIYEQYRESLDERLLMDFTSSYDFIKFYVYAAAERDEQVVKSLFRDDPEEELYVLFETIASSERFIILESKDEGQTFHVHALLVFDTHPVSEIHLFKDDQGIWRILDY